MPRGYSLILTLAAALPAALPAAAQERGGVAMRDPVALLSQVDANRGCPMSSTSVTVGLNKTIATGASAQQRLLTSGSDPSGCRPLVSTQVVTGVNMALGRGSSAGQAINATGPAGALATTTYTRGYNYSYGALSSASQRLINRTGR